MKRLALTAIAMACLLAACASGPSRRVSDPAANIQQLTVRADGSWSSDLRIDNFSNVPMHFAALSLAMTVDGAPAGTLQATPALVIGPESADGARGTLVRRLAGTTNRAKHRSYPPNLVVCSLDHALAGWVI